MTIAEQLRKTDKELLEALHSTAGAVTNLCALIDAYRGIAAKLERSSSQENSQKTERD